MPTAIRQRNLTLECCKFVASLFVIFLHVPFPGTFGQVVSCLARFAVPLFFAVSGWFSYGAAPQTLAKRFWKILRLELLGSAIYALWTVFLAEYYGGSSIGALKELFPGVKTLLLWLGLNVNPFCGHLWYLSAAAMCYGLFWAYAKGGWSYRPLYLLAAALMAGHFAMAELSRFTGLAAPFYLCRSGIFFGVPMFVLGLFLREYRGRFRNPRWLVPVGIAVSLGEMMLLGGFDMYLGTIATVAGTLLLTDKHPAVPRKWEKTAARLGVMSTYIYLLHMLVLYAYDNFLRFRLEAAPWESWLRPGIIVAVTVPLAALITFVPKPALRKT